MTGGATGLTMGCRESRTLQAAEGGLFSFRQPDSGLTNRISIPVRPFFVSAQRGPSDARPTNLPSAWASSRRAAGWRCLPHARSRRSHLQLYEAVGLQLPRSTVVDDSNRAPSLVDSVG